MPKVLVLRDTLIALACSLPAAHADTIPFQTHRLKFAICCLVTANRPVLLKNTQLAVHDM
jgi:hypothetical protein